MEIQYRSHIKDRNGVTFIAIINPVYLNPKVRPSNYNIKIIGGLIFYEVHI